MRQGEGAPDFRGAHRQLQNDIQATNAEIRLLNSRIATTDYETTHLRRLEQRHQALLEKQQELAEATHAQNYTQVQVAQQRAQEKDMRHSLGTQYVQLAEERKRRAEQERRWMVEQERLVQDQTRRALEEDQIRRKQAMEEQKRGAMEELAMREETRRKEKEERERQKEQYNRRAQYRSQLQTQKDSVYKQYYNQFMENQDTLQGIYRNKAAVSERDRQYQREQFQQKEIQQFQDRVAKDQQERVRRMTEEKDMLRSFLQGQIEDKQRRKSRERDEELTYQNQVARFQVNSQQSQLLQRSKKREDQKRYDQELKMQSRSKVWSSSEGMVPPRQGPHNPITNPIDFKIGITNPYLIREYEREKERQLGEQQLRLRNLAVLGNATLHHH